MKMISEAMAGASALKTAFDMAKALKDISDATIRNGAVIELQEKILSAQQEQFVLASKAEDLLRENNELKGAQKRLHRYQLRDYGGGTFAYELKPSEADGEPNHRACAACYQAGSISILQFSHQSSGQDWYDCPKCGVGRPLGSRTATAGYRSNHADYF